MEISANNKNDMCLIELRLCDALIIVKEAGRYDKT